MRTKPLLFLAVARYDGQVIMFWEYATLSGIRSAVGHYKKKEHTLEIYERIDFKYDAKTDTWSYSEKEVASTGPDAEYYRHMAREKKARKESAHGPSQASLLEQIDVRAKERGLTRTRWLEKALALDVVAPLPQRESCNGCGWRRMVKSAQGAWITCPTCLVTGNPHTAQNPLDDC